MTRKQTSSEEEIQFRSKFIKTLSSSPANSYVSLEEIASLVSKFNKLSEQKALSVLWTITHDEDELINFVSLCFSSLEDFTRSRMSYNFCRSFRNELRYQYFTAHPELSRKFDNLSNFDFVRELINLDAGKVITMAILSKCQHFIYQSRPNRKLNGDGEVNRCIYLLNTKLPTKSYGGLRTLGFNHAEASFLNDHDNYAYKIANILKCLSTFSEEELQAINLDIVYVTTINIIDFSFMEDSSTDAPAENTVESSTTEESTETATSISDTPAEEAESSAEEEESFSSESVASTSDESSEVVSLSITAENIIKYQKSIRQLLHGVRTFESFGINPVKLYTSRKFVTQFFEDVSEIENIGFNPGDIFSRLQEIENLIKAIDDLEIPF